MKEELLAWSKHFRENFDKLLLFFLLLALVSFVIHMIHDKTDIDNISWGRELTGTVLGGLLGLITGAKLAQLNIKKETESEK